MGSWPVSSARPHPPPNHFPPTRPGAVGGADGRARPEPGGHAGGPWMGRSYASSRRRWMVLESAVEVAGDVALEAAFDLSGGLSFRCSAGDVGLGCLVVADPCEHDGVQGA